MKYKVKSPGFFEGVLYDPAGKRPWLHTDKEIKPVPSWLEAPEKETAAQRRTRLAAEKKAESEALEAEEMKRKEVDAVSFIEKPSATVHTI